MKPVLTTEEALKSIDLSKYTLEKKYDGWRVIVIHEGQIKFYTRQKREIQVSNSIRDSLHKMNIPRGTVLDGEIWNPLKRAEWTNIDLWDVIRNGTHGMSKCPIEERKSQLQKLINGDEVVKIVGSYQATFEIIEQIKEEAWEARKKNDLSSGFIHGVVLKKKGSLRYDNANRSTENPNWLKVVFDGMKGYEPR